MMKRVSYPGNLIKEAGKVGTKMMSSEEIKTIYKPHLENATCICSDKCPSYRLLAEKLNIKLHAFKSSSKEKRGIYPINHVNYVHRSNVV